MNVLLDLAPGEKVSRGVLLDRQKRWSLEVQVASAGEVEVVLYRGIDAMREESAGEGRVNEGHSTGRRFTLLTPPREGGYWLFTLENLSRFPEKVSFQAWAIEAS